MHRLLSISIVKPAFHGVMALMPMPMFLRFSGITLQRYKKNLNSAFPKEKISN